MKTNGGAEKGEKAGIFWWEIKKDQGGRIRKYFWILTHSWAGRGCLGTELFGNHDMGSSMLATVAGTGNPKL